MSLPIAKSGDTSVSNLRGETRTHLFMVAMLSAATTLVPVRIRNLSASGALIEGSALPAVRSAVTIRRGDLSVEGVLVWRSKNQAGLAFKSNIFVPTWLPKNSGSKQSAIDQIMFEAKDGSGVSTEQPKLGCLPAGSDGVLFELTSLRNDLTTLEDALVQDIILVATHPEIQLLDIAIQRIDRLLSLTEATARVPRRTRPSDETVRKRFHQNLTVDQLLPDRMRYSPGIDRGRDCCQDAPA